MAETLPAIEVTKTVYTVQDFMSWYEDGRLELRPYFQRGSVWTPRARSFLIDTLLRGFPVPVIFLQTKRDLKTLSARRHVVDGQQRLRAVLSYVRPDLIALEKNETAVRLSKVHNAELAGRTFDQLPPDLQARILDTEFSVHLLPADLPDRVLLELFARLNSTGEKLNDQELRNAEYHGAFKTCAYRLAYDHVEVWEQWKLFPSGALAKMKDVEFTSELMLAVIEGLQAKSKARIDNAYRQFDEEFPQQAQVEHELRRTIDLLVDSSTPARDLLKSQSWVYALFVFVSARSALPSASQMRHALVELDQRLRELDELPDDLQKALRGASTDRSSREARVRFIEESFDRDAR
ncbi:DUF262 domain-containing protein [Microbacterium sp. A1-JK]|uniref:DUF262 domain-containing protein n=1 Tax=Microbacterium sp. A1-JK TaxID=3177516 RepID=UPI00388723B5